jgi:hypothetical protein
MQKFIEMVICYINVSYLIISVTFIFRNPRMKCGCFSTSLIVPVKRLTLLFRIQKILNSNLGSETSYSDIFSRQILE